MSNQEVYCCDGSNEDDIVISGVSGRFGENKNIEEFRNFLYGQDHESRMQRHRQYFENTPDSMLQNVTKFDAKFFNVSERAARILDPQLRILCEIIYETAVDAGYTMDELTKFCVGTYCGGSCTSFPSSHVSEIFKFQGPCFMAKNTPASFLLAMNEAYINLSQNACDAAIVAGVELESLSKNPALESNTEEYIGAILLQKAKKARRIYATITNVERKILQAKIPDEMQMKLYSDISRNNNLNPSSILFLEKRKHHLAEILSLSPALCNAKDPLLFLDTNMNDHKHKAEVFGLNQVVKAILCFQTGTIPVDASQNSEILSLKQEPQLITKPTSWNGHYISLKSIEKDSITHICLQNKMPMKVPSSHSKGKEMPKMLVFYSGRSREEIQNLFDNIRRSPEEKELCYLLQKLSPTPLSHSYRGFLLLQKKELFQLVDKRRSKARSLYYVFPCIGSQWPGMGLSLMKFDVFARSFNKANAVLERYQLDLLDILKPNANFLYEKNHISSTFATITAIHIALVDLLASIGLKPDGMIGHSVGEVACAYADGCYTVEQTMLLSYWAGKALENSDVPKGKMIVVGMSTEKAKEMCPENVYIACHNSDELVTISGRVTHINGFLRKLKGKNMNSHNVKSNDIAFHSPVLASASEELLKKMSKVIPEPKKRSNRWISTCYSKEDRDLPEANLADAAYFTHNLLSPVLFREALREVPKDAVLLEIGPHCMFRSIITQVMDSNAECLSLMEREVDNSECLLRGIGKLYNLGFNPSIEALCPPYEFPVPRWTPMLANFVKWDHSRGWKIPWKRKKRIHIDLKTKSNSFLIDHKMDGKIIFPTSAYLVAVWQTFSNFRRKSISQTPVIFRNVEVIERCILQGNAITDLDIEILENNGHFKIEKNNQLLATGLIRALKCEDSAFDESICGNEESSLILKREHIYNHLKSLGYNYGPEFQNILEAHLTGYQGLIEWNNNWVTYIDSIISFMRFAFAKIEADFLGKVDYLKIDPYVQNSILDQIPDGKVKGMRIFHNKIISKAICGGVEIGTVEFQPKGRMENTHRVIYESQTFIPFIEECMLPTNQQLSRNIYLEKCDDAATALTQLMKNETSEKVAIINYSNTVPIQSQLLLSTLKNILDGVQHKDKHLEHEFKNYLINIQDDFLVRTFLSNTTFKKVFDIIEENCFSSTIHVFEINSHYNPLSAQLSAILRKMNSKRWQFTILPDFSSLISSNSSNNEFAENETTNSETIAESVLICSFYSGSFSDLQTFVSVLSNLRNKFILVIYRSKVPNAEKVLRTFFKMSKDEHSATVFEQMLEQSNMCTIARKSDSHGMHLYLLRKCTNIDNPLIYDLAKDNCDHLKIYITDNFKNRTEKSPPLWILIDNKSINNIEDFFREFRKEDVKFIYVEDGIFEEQQLNTTNFKYDDVLKKNLVTSVFKNGQWGSFYHELLENDPDSVAPVCEFSGRNQKAKRNCGIAKQCLSSMVQVYKNIAWPVPTDLTSNEAFILSYFISYYGLIWKGKLKEKQSILISGGASNVGQAAIHIALSMNCEIFTTVGVDMIFSSFSGNQLMAAFDCLASNGKLIHYGKLDASINDVLDICVLSNNASIISINPISIFENQCQHSFEEKISEKIHGLILDGVSNGVVKPLRATLSNREKMGNITKLSENEDVVGQNIAKEEKIADVIPPQPQRNLVSPVTFFYAMKNYIIIDGLTTFGMLLGDWLVKRGVKKLTISTQKILNDGERQHFPEAWKHFGIEVTVRNLTSSNSNEVSQLLRDAEKDGPVGGIFVLISENSQVEDTIKNLDSESRSLCGSLDWFTCFSPSLGCKNYARNVCRNAIIERVCEQRCKDHLNGTIIHWDVIEGEDVVDWSSESIVPTPLQRQLMNLFLIELQNILEMNKRVICCRFLQNN